MLRKTGFEYGACWKFACRTIWILGILNFCNLETLKRLVEQDFGVTLMPYLALNDIDKRCANGVIKNFKDPIPSRKIRLVYSREFLKKNLIEAFAEVIKDSIPEDLRDQEEKLVIE